MPFPIPRSGSTAGEPAYARVRDRLRDDLLSGQFAPGQRLTVAELSARYRTSSMPIRVALQELHGQGLVALEPRRGARVRAVDEDFITNLYDLRIAVLTILYPRAVRHLSDADIEAVEAIQDAAERATEASDLSAVRRDTYRFHMRIYEAARNPEAFRVMERTWVLVNALRATYGFGPGRLEDANRNHREIVRALRARDAGRAIELARASAERARADLIGLVVGAVREEADGRASRAAGAGG